MQYEHNDRLPLSLATSHPLSYIHKSISYILKHDILFGKANLSNRRCLCVRRLPLSDVKPSTNALYDNYIIENDHSEYNQQSKSRRSVSRPSIETAQSSVGISARRAKYGKYV